MEMMRLMAKLAFLIKLIIIKEEINIWIQDKLFASTKRRNDCDFDKIDNDHKWWWKHGSISW